MKSLGKHAVLSFIVFFDARVSILFENRQVLKKSPNLKWDIIMQINAELSYY